MRLLIFDMDGVLIDSNHAWYEIFNDTLEHFEGKEISREEFDRDVWAYDFDETAKKYFTADKKKILDYFDKKRDNFSSFVKIYPDVRETLKTLKEQGYVLSVATNTHKSLAKEILEEKGLLEFFDLVLGGDDVTKGKPAPDILLLTLDELKMKKEDALFIGDTMLDEIAAEKASVHFLGLRHGKNRIETLKELLKAV